MLQPLEKSTMSQTPSAEGKYEEKMNSDDSSPPERKCLGHYVKLNVGGYLFQTTIATLTSQQGMLKNMFEGDFEIKEDSDGFVMIDRDGLYFSEILNFLRKGSISSLKSTREIKNILAEAEFYQIEPLICSLKENLSSLEIKKDYLPNIQNPIIFQSKDDNIEEIIKEATEPVFYLVIDSRHSSSAIGHEIHRFREASEKYRDLFLFVLGIFTQKDFATWWTLYFDGESVNVTASLDSFFRESTLPLLIKYIRNLKAKNCSLSM